MKILNSCENMTIKSGNKYVYIINNVNLGKKGKKHYSLINLSYESFCELE